METITIKVKSNADAIKVMELLKKQTIEMEITKIEKPKKVAKTLKNKDVVSKEEFLKDLRAGLKEVKEIQEGKRKKNTMKDFNDYVQS
ncbi:MAG: hypothetical protein SFU27_10780 [Thermonemataceae bacterium]|nr:hypothetical protein [Thermonemataceae bacterium]